MKVEIGTFKTEDGLNLHYRYFHKPEAVKTLVILHGHGEHSGRYEKFSRFLSGEPVSIAVYDARGAGQSDGREVYVDSLEDYIRDVSSFTAFLKDRYDALPLTLLGHSLGGLVALHWALRFPHKITKLILSSPCLGLKIPKPLLCMNNFFNRVVPGLIYKNPVYPPHLTHNPDEVDHYRKDQLIKRKISVRLLAEMIKYGNLIEAKDHIEVPFPVYVLMAGLEKVVDKERTMRVFERIKAPQKNLQTFEGFYHEIFNELGQEKVFDALIACLRDPGASVPEPRYPDSHSHD